jgi:hypothetical protein
MKWEKYEEDTVKAFTYMSNKEISSYLREKGYEKTPKQISDKKSRLGKRKE